MSSSRKLHDFYIAVSNNEIVGHEPINIFGFNSSIDGSFIAAWENNISYVFPPSAVTMTLQSTDNSDTATILVKGLTANYEIYQESFALTGNTAVTIPTDLLRINELVTTAGNAAGTVTIENGGTVYGQINPGIGKSQMSVFTVPDNSRLFVYRLDAWSATTSGASKYLTWRNQITLKNGTQLSIAETTFVENLNVLRVFPLVYEAGTDIQFQVKSSSGLNEIGIFVEGVLITEPPYTLTA